jgi:hypothetical protein
MLRKPLLSLLIALVLAAVFVFGLFQLFALRYQVGDVYPEYSTLRADPLGTKALVDSLAELPHVETRRNFKPLTKLRPDGPVTLVYAGVAHHSYWTDEELLAFDSLLANGSRAVFTFFPVEKVPSADDEKRSNETEEQKKQKSEDAKKKRKKKDKDDKGAKDAKDDKSKDEDKEHKDFTPFSVVAKRWGFGFDYLSGPPIKRRASLVEPGGKLEPDISWHGALYFKDLKPQWHVLYLCETKPVVIERKFGSGSMILAADSFFISNEALRGERHSRLIARMFDGPMTIVFDEEHNNLRDNPGIASLARKYRLHGVVASLLLLAIFFVWKNAVRFVPAYETTVQADDVVAGKESGEGFVNLLRRSIRHSAIFDTCIAEWRKAFANQPRELAKLNKIQADLTIRPAADRQPIAAYTIISRALARKV